MNTVIYHSLDCQTLRNVLRIIRTAGYDLTVIEYLHTVWARPQLLSLLAITEETSRSALWIKRSSAKAMGLTDSAIGDDRLIKAMLSHPILVNRPFVACRNCAALCRPSGRVLDLLDR